MLENRELPINKIRLGKNSRLHTTESEVSDLMQSIKNVGLLQPIGVVKKNQFYEVAYGNRRFMAMSKLGWKKIPVIIKTPKDQSEQDIQNLAENIQRRNISITEAGRYFKELNAAGYALGEICIKLGVPHNYVRSCIEAFDEVPPRFAKDIVQTSSRSRVPAGKISFSTAKRIISAKKNIHLTSKQTEKLFAAAKSDDRFTEADIMSYAEQAKKNKKDPIGAVMPTKSLRTALFMDQSEYEKLHKKYIENGPFNSLTSVIVAILKGEISTRIKSVRTS